jgi:hypothetical protein
MTEPDAPIRTTHVGSLVRQGPYIQRVHPTIHWSKLRSLAEGAGLASRALTAAR